MWHQPEAANLALPWFPEHSPLEFLGGVNTSCCDSYNSQPLISICPWLSTLPSQFCFCPYKIWEHQGISCAASGFISSLPPFLLQQEHKQLQMLSDISESIPTLLRHHSWQSPWPWHLAYLSSDLWEICFLKISNACLTIKLSSSLAIASSKMNLGFKWPWIWKVALSFIGNITSLSHLYPSFLICYKRLCLPKMAIPINK